MEYLNRRELLAAVSGGAFAAALGPADCSRPQKRIPPAGKAKRPNIIFLMTDDQRWDALGCMKNPVIKTPHLDKLTSNGVLFTNNFVTTSICCSSRASILSGQYMRRHGIEDFSTSFSEDALQQTWPLLLKRAGYRIGFVGKWGIGSLSPTLTRQFDYWKGFGGQGRYFPEGSNGKRHLTNTMAEQSIQFLRAAAPLHHPFCLSVSFKAPHAQRWPTRIWTDYDPAFENLYKDAQIPVRPNAALDAARKMPNFLQKMLGAKQARDWLKNPEKLQFHLRGYYRLITGADAAVGKILSELERLNLGHNTVIIFTSDNGHFFCEHGFAGKWLMYEESIRVPLIIYDPRLPATQKASRCSEITLNLDIAPTILELAGIDAPEAIQGTSMVELLTGSSKKWREEFFYEHHFTHPPRFTIPRCEGVRTKNHKYIHYIDRTPAYEELYDLQHDPYELYNLAGKDKHQNTNMLKQMRKKCRTYQTALI